MRILPLFALVSIAQAMKRPNDTLPDQNLAAVSERIRDEESNEDSYSLENTLGIPYLMI